MVLQRVQLKNRLDRDIFDGHETSAIEVQARELFISDCHLLSAL